VLAIPQAVAQLRILLGLAHEQHGGVYLSAREVERALYVLDRLDALEDETRRLREQVDSQGGELYCATLRGDVAMAAGRSVLAARARGESLHTALDVLTRWLDQMEGLINAAR
jgi:hypothetical protein